MSNHYDFSSLDHLSFSWVLEDEGIAVTSGKLDVPSVPSGQSAEVPLPLLPEVGGESWLTVLT